MPRSINIGPYSFKVTPGYSTGAYEITKTELEALDTLRFERIRKKGFKVLEKLRAKSGRRTLSEVELKYLTEEIEQFDREVGLDKGSNEVPARPSLSTFDLLPGAFEAELERLIEARVDSEERARGLSLGASQRESAKEALREDPSLREAARVRVEIALSERDKLMGDLF